MMNAAWGRITVRFNMYPIHTRIKAFLVESSNVDHLVGLSGDNSLIIPSAIER